MALPQNQYLKDSKPRPELSKASVESATHQTFVKLKDKEPIARGQRRDVYVHPDQPGLLIKTLRADTPTKWYKSKRRRYGGYLSYLREVREQIALRASGGPHPPYVQRIVGFQDTDMGFGIVVEALRGPDGELAPSLSKLVADHTYDSQVEKDLEAFLSELLESPIMLGDFHSNNIVYVDQPDGSKRFVLIDGYGFKTLVPLERIHPAINRMGKARLIKRFKERLELGLTRMRAIANAQTKSLPE